MEGFISYILLKRIGEYNVYQRREIVILIPTSPHAALSNVRVTNFIKCNTSPRSQIRMKVHRISRD